LNEKLEHYKVHYKGVSGFWCHRLKRPAYDLCVTVTIHHYCVGTCGPCNY